MNNRINKTDPENDGDLTQDQINAVSILVVPTGLNWTAVRGDWVEDAGHPEGLGLTPDIAVKNLLLIETQQLLEEKEADSVSGDS
jgi:hypothetical protein